VGKGAAGKGRKTTYEAIKARRKGEFHIVTLDAFE
jgi:hypothetical protein